MSSTFKITITAVDRATAVVRKVKDNISKMTRPWRQMFQSVRTFGKEIGLEKTVKGFASLASGVAGVALKIGGVVAALAAVAGIESMAAIARLARAWAFTGSEITRTAGIIPIAVERLQSLRGAAKLVGLSAEDMDGALKNVGTTIEDALYGRNQEALAIMGRLHIALRKTKDGSIDTAASLYEVAGAISRIKNVQAQALVARTFGVEQLLPLLQRGPAGLADLERKIKATQSILDPASIKRMAQFQEGITTMQLALTGLANSIGNRFLPSLTPAVNRLNEFIERTAVAIQKHQETLLIFNGADAVVKGATGQKGGMKMPLGFHFGNDHKGLSYNWMNPFGLLGRLAETKFAKGMGDVVLRLLRGLEGSGDNAVSRPAFRGSRGGAVGRFQIMPDTATRYGFDKSRLTDPAYNTKVATAILADLAQKYGRDIDKILIGYNSTPRMVDRFTKANRDPRVLLPETQHYLWRAHHEPALLKLLNEAIAGGNKNANAQPARVEVIIKGAPAGTTASVKPGQKAHVSVKVEHAMPSLVTP